MRMENIKERLKNGELAEAYEGTYTVDNVSKIAISEKFDAVPRKSEKIKKVPEKLKEAINNQEIIDIDAIDLDGDGNNEYVVSRKDNNDKGFSEIDLIKYMEKYDNYYVVAPLISIKGENNFDFTHNLDDLFEFSSDSIEYLDIDNDGIIEIIIELPFYEGLGVSIYKYKDGIAYGDLNYEASTMP